ncbi:hypothetical protein [Flavobacterium haoranii]|uniref:Uncharacterized protein n=1 Tax=Flavobacterium haoranii TaxID=683124 RepID=A0A1M6F0E6_9FLAO|nr:hypothetical protein [Flavobacterium haoranii]SHI91116.1 hypothetical protein SAMN05444337_1091 [Flavobacterium haoranii]
MKKIYLLFIWVSYISFGQVGIGTQTPQQDLHVAGSNSTIRIEGLDVINNVENNGLELTPVYVTNKGNLTLTPPTYISGGTGYELPLIILMDTPNFVPDNILSLPVPYNDHGRVINSDNSTESVTGLIHSITITVPSASMIEFKYAMSILYSATDLSSTPYDPSFITDERTRSYQTYFCIDLFSDGLDATELAKHYGTKGQYYGTAKGGTRGYTYMNSQAYATLPSGTHTVYFYGVVNDPPDTYTSIGFGGANEYLKIRVY